MNIEKKYNKKRIGEIHKTDRGYFIEIINGGTKPHYCTIKIGNWISEAQYVQVVNGVVKYPFYKSVHKVGYFGVGIYNKKDYKKLYLTWVSMLGRAYYLNYHKHQPTYLNATVCNEWHNLQTFGKWFEENYVEGYELDKDLLSDSKIYSPDTSIFIPRELNLFISRMPSNNTSGYIGVHLDKHSGKWKAQISINGKQKNLGLYIDIVKASKTYVEARAKEALRFKKMYKNVLSEVAINRIK